MLVHHDNRTYAEAASTAAAHARVKLESLIENGRARAGRVIEQIANTIPVDRIVPAERFRVLTGGGGPHPEIRACLEGLDGPTGFKIHDHALAQISERAEVPFAYIQSLRGKGMVDLAATNLDRMIGRQRAERRFLVRSVETGKPEIRGFLSDKFRRLDSRPIVDEFIKACQSVGALAYDGNALDTKIAIKAILPRVFEPVPNEVMAFGAVLQNSDFGDGALSLRTWMLRLYCTNEAIMEEALRQIHLGGKLGDDMSFSERTYRLDTARSASMIRDVVAASLSPEKVASVCGVIQKANEEGVTAASVKSFLERRLLKTEAKAATDAFNSADIQNLPAGQTAWRLSNAISWIANSAQDEHRKLELQQIAALALPSNN